MGSRGRYSKFALDVIGDLRGAILHLKAYIRLHPHCATTLHKIYILTFESDA